MTIVQKLELPNIIIFNIMYICNNHNNSITEVDNMMIIYVIYTSKFQMEDKVKITSI